MKGFILLLILTLVLFCSAYYFESKFENLSIENQIYIEQNTIAKIHYVTLIKENSENVYLVHLEDLKDYIDINIYDSLLKVDVYEYLDGAEKIVIIDTYNYNNSQYISTDSLIYILKENYKYDVLGNNNSELIIITDDVYNKYRILADENQKYEMLSLKFLAFAIVIIFLILISFIFVLFIY